MTTGLENLLQAHLKAEVPPVIEVVAAHVKERHGNVRAVIAYGSALRDSTPAETLIDLYVLTGDIGGISSNMLSRLACRLVPPNVHYAEVSHGGQIYRAKYAVLTVSQLEARVSPATSNPYFWARFAQPMRLVWSADDESEAGVLRTFSAACITAWANAIATSPDETPTQKWSNLFRETYRTELRPESGDRAGAIIEANQSYFEEVSSSIAAPPAIQPNWQMRRMVGKLLSILRLAKASFTFQGGADYIAWKIKRHSGVEIKVSDFHRRHPLLAGVLLLPQLLRRGAVR